MVVVTVRLCTVCELVFVSCFSFDCDFPARAFLTNSGPGLCQCTMADWWIQHIDERVGALKNKCMENHNRLNARVEALEEKIEALAQKFEVFFAETAQIEKQNNIIDGLVNQMAAQAAEIAGIQNAPLAAPAAPAALPAPAAPAAAPVAAPAPCAAPAAAPVAAPVAAPTTILIGSQNRLILVDWMDGHRFYRPPVTQPPPPPPGAGWCNHA